jgi:hypothetical protein
MRISAARKGPSVWSLVLLLAWVSTPGCTKNQKAAAAAAALAQHRQEVRQTQQRSQEKQQLRSYNAPDSGN